MENERRKSNIRLGTLILSIVLTVLLTAIITVVVYRQLVNDTSTTATMLGSNQGNPDYLDLPSVDSQSNVILQENTISQNNTISGQNVIEMENSTTNENNVEESANLSMPIYLNGNKHQLTVRCSFEKWDQYEEESLYIQGLEIAIDGKKYSDIESNNIHARERNKNSIIYEMPEIKIIKSKEGKEYILLLVKTCTPSSESTIMYILGEDGKNIGKIRDYAETSFTVIENNYTLPAHNISSDYISITVPTSDRGAEIRKYTVENEKIKYEIEEKYTRSELNGAGASV